MVLKRLANQPGLTMPIVEWIDNGRLHRTIMRIYYSKDCLPCHRNPKGILDISGYPREGDRVGKLARAISIQIPRTIGSRQPVLDGGKQRGDLLPMTFEKLSSTPRSVAAALSHHSSLFLVCGPVLPPPPT